MMKPLSRDIYNLMKNTTTEDEDLDRLKREVAFYKDLEDLAIAKLNDPNYTRETRDSIINDLRSHTEVRTLLEYRHAELRRSLL